MSKFLIFVILFYFIAEVINAESSVKEVDIECHVEYSSPVYHHLTHNTIRCLSERASLVIDSSTTTIRKVIDSEIDNEGETDDEVEDFDNQADTSNIEILHIYQARSIEFMPAGIKTKFPRLKAIIIIDSRLSHLEQNDMKQFGDDLIYADFSTNLISAFRADLFEYNPNMKLINFSENFFTFVEPALFKNLRAMVKLVHLKFKNAGCIYSDYEFITDVLNELEGEDLNCGDINAENENKRLISERQIFFAQANKQITEQNKLNETIRLHQEEEFQLENTTEALKREEFVLAENNSTDNSKQQ